MPVFHSVDGYQNIPTHETYESDAQLPPSKGVQIFEFLHARRFTIGFFIGVTFTMILFACVDWKLNTWHAPLEGCQFPYFYNHGCKYPTDLYCAPGNWGDGGCYPFGNGSSSICMQGAICSASTEFHLNEVCIPVPFLDFRSTPVQCYDASKEHCTRDGVETGGCSVWEGNPKIQKAKWCDEGTLGNGGCYSISEQFCHLGLISKFPQN
jgi:hypothetical protein